MKVLVSSDETGTIKEVICPRGTDTSKKDGVKPSAVTKVCSEPAPSIKSRVIHMTVVGEYLITLRINGVVCVYTLDDYELVKEVSLCEDKPISLVNYSEYDSVVVAFETCRIFVIELDQFKTAEVALPVHSDDKGKIISSFVSNEFKSAEFAYGGEEFDVKIVSLFDTPSTSFINTKFDPKFVYIAENVENDFLDLRVPISIKHIRFLDQNKFITVTKYGQLRVYDRDESKAPAHDFKICPKPIIQATVTGDDVVLSDTTSLIAKYSLTKIDPNAIKIHSASAGDLRRPSVKLLGKFTEGGNTGATHAIYNFKNKFVATGGLDRYLRVFDINSRKLVAKVYVSTQISTIILLSDEEEDKDLEPKKLSKKKRLNPEQEREEDEELWNELETISKPKEKKIQKKSRRL